MVCFLFFFFRRLFIVQLRRLFLNVINSLCFSEMETKDSIILEGFRSGISSCLREFLENFRMTNFLTVPEVITTLFLNRTTIKFPDVKFEKNFFLFFSFSCLKILTKLFELVNEVSFPTETGLSCKYWWLRLGLVSDFSYGSRRNTYRNFLLLVQFTLISVGFKTTFMVPCSPKCLREESHALWSIVMVECLCWYCWIERKFVVF